MMYLTQRYVKATLIARAISTKLAREGVVGGTMPGTCASGASLKGGVSATKQIEIGGDLWRELMGRNANWWDYIVSFFAPTYVQASTLCASNPVDPGDPSISDWINAIGRDPFTILRIGQWWQDKLSYLAFAENCVCNSPAPFSCTTHFAHPHTGANASSGAQDYSFGVEFVPSSDLWLYGGWFEIGTVGSSTIQHGVVESGGAGLSHLENITPTTGDQKHFFATPQRLLSGHTYKYFFQFPNAGWAFDYDGFNTTPTTTAFATYTQAVYRSPIASSWLPFTPFTVPPDPLFCPDAGTPPLPVDPVQPPDLVTPVPPTCITTGDLCVQINALSDRLIWVQRALTVLQRRELPFQWLAGTPSTGLTGTGTLAVQDAIGVTVDLTTVPATWGSTAETPRHLIPAAGSIQADDGTEYTANTQLHYEHQVVMLNAPWATAVRYNLRPGIHATITPLYPVP